jgi:hypothetical protein
LRPGFIVYTRPVLKLNTHLPVKIDFELLDISSELGAVPDGSGKPSITYEPAAGNRVPDIAMCLEEFSCSISSKRARSNKLEQCCCIAELIDVENKF